MSASTTRPPVKRQYGSRKRALPADLLYSSSPSSSASASSSSSFSNSYRRSSFASSSWADLLDAESEGDTTTADLSFSSATSSLQSGALDSPPTSPNTSSGKGKEVEKVGEVTGDEVLEMPTSSGSSRVLRHRAPEKTNLLSFFKPSSSPRRGRLSDPSGSDPDSPPSHKKKRRQDLGRPSKRAVPTASAASTKEHKPKLEQLFLDPYETAGNSTLSCAVCSLSYARTPDDLALHVKHHKRVVGGCDWTAADGKGDTVLEDSIDWGTNEGGKIVMVDAAAEGPLGRKIKDVLFTIDTELSSTSLTTSQLADCKLFVFLTPQRKAISCAVVQRIESAFQVIPPSDAPPPSSQPSSNPTLLRFGEPSSAVFCSPTPHPTFLGVQRIWTSSSHRHQNLASRLLDVAAKRFIYGCPVERSTGVAFSQPTGAGMGLARRWTGTESFRVFVD